MPFILSVLLLPMLCLICAELPAQPSVPNSAYATCNAYQKFTLTHSAQRGTSKRSGCRTRAGPQASVVRVDPEPVQKQRQNPTPDNPIFGGQQREPSGLASAAVSAWMERCYNYHSLFCTTQCKGNSKGLEYITYPQVAEFALVSLTGVSCHSGIKTGNQ